MTEPLATVRADVHRTDLQPDPIAPATVLDGAPVARSLMLTQSADARVSTHLWDCTAGRFTWWFGVDEIVHILEGEVHIEDESGARFTLRSGDVGHFAFGATTVWDVPHYVRKLAFHRAPTRRTRAVRKLRTLLPVGSLGVPWVLELPERALSLA